MAKRCCSALDVDGRESSLESASKRRKVKASTYQKWVRDYDCKYKTLSWHDSETSWHNREKVVEKLKCKVCTKYKERIISRRNFSNKWIEGVDSVRTTNLIDHAKSEQHIHAMNLLRKEEAQSTGVDITTYMPIVQSLSSISEQECQKLRIKFYIAYFIATEQLAYQKYPKLCGLQTKLGMNLGSATFFSLLMDGSTDSSNSENEMILVMWCNVESDDHKIHTSMAYL